MHGARQSLGARAHVLLLLLISVCAVEEKLVQQGRFLRLGKRTDLVPGSPEYPIIFIEMGSNNGKWMDARMNETLLKNETALCFAFEPQPHLVNGPLGIVTRRHNCTLIPQPVWIEAKVMTFHTHGDDVTSTLLTSGHFSHAKFSYNVTSIDIVDWMLANVDPKAYIYARMDIEGAEYAVLRHMLLNGVACWFDYLELEFHAYHHDTNYYMRPVDVAVPWLMRGCGVLVKPDASYHKFMIKKDDPCTGCDQLRWNFDMEAAGKAAETASAAAAAAAAAALAASRGR